MPSRARIVSLVHRRGARRKPHRAALEDCAADFLRLQQCKALPDAAPWTSAERQVAQGFLVRRPGCRQQSRRSLGNVCLEAKGSEGIRFLPMHWVAVYGIDGEAHSCSCRQVYRSRIAKHRASRWLSRLEDVALNNGARPCWHRRVETKCFKKATPKELGLPLPHLSLGALVISGVRGQQVQTPRDQVRGGVVAREEEGQRLVPNLRPGKPLASLPDHGREQRAERRAAPALALGSGLGWR
mmetsp:Transcript_108780/g.347201  ORF Transcript_108780/g.347201 Transcript_108780/m.347201 type:complete len:241 (+) Transcript_108780:186-908(+)